MHKEFWFGPKRRDQIRQCLGQPVARKWKITRILCAFVVGN